MNTIRAHRQFLKDSLRKEIDFRQTDQSRGVEPPPVVKPFDASKERVSLPGIDDLRPGVQGTDVVTAIENRRSRRSFTNASLSQEDLAFLLWATQGVREPARHGHALRTVPSAGARHSFETYLFVMRVEGVSPGLYRYLPLEHELLLERTIDRMHIALAVACLGQRFVGRASVTFAWTTIPYRMEWRYGLSAHRVILIDAGHVCQNLYTACACIGAGTCAIAAYDQEALDALLGVDGEDEFSIYVAPVGKV